MIFLLKLYEKFNWLVTNDQDYKIIGAGTKSTLTNEHDGKPRIMSLPGALF